MRLGEALARCAWLTLVPPDPAGVADFVGAAAGAPRVDRGGRRAGAAGAGLLRRARVAAPARHRDAREQRRRPGGRRARRRQAGCACRRASGWRRRALRRWRRRRKARVRRPVIVSGGRKQAAEFLARASGGAAARATGAGRAPRGARAAGHRHAWRAGGARLRRRWPIASGRPGCIAHELANGGDGALRPRPASEFLRESLELPEAASGIQLERGLGLLIDRLLARRERRGRTLRAVVLSAVLVEQGGTWREQVVFREALADPVRMRLALAPRLALMPAPAEELRLAVERFGPPTSDQRALLEDPAEARVGAAARGDTAGSGSCRPRRCPAGARSRSLLALSRAARDADSVRGMSGAVSGPRRLSVPRRVAVTAGDDGCPLLVDSRTVDAVQGVVAGRGSLVDRSAASSALLGGGDHVRSGRGRVPRPREWEVVETEVAHDERLLDCSLD